MTTHLDDMERKEDTRPRWRRPLSWSVLIVAGWLLYELTTQPMLASMVICTKFGWEDFRTALWLRRTDPYRPRAKACFALYVASGLWKTAITASIMFFAIAMISIPPKQEQPAPAQQQEEVPATFVGALVAAFLGYTLLALATCRALWISMRHRLKLWLSSAVHRARWQSLWPPNAVCQKAPNKAQRVLLTTLFVLGFPLLMTGIINVAPPPQAGGKGDGLIVIWLVVGISVAAVLFLGLRDLLDRHVVARSPWECWGDGTTKDPDQDYLTNS